MQDQPDSLDTALAALDPFERRVAEAYAGEAAGNMTKAFELAGHEGTYATRATLGWRLSKKVEFNRAVNAMLELDPLVAGRVERLRFLTRVMRGLETEARAIGRDEDGKPIVEDAAPSMRDRLAAQDALAKLGGDYVTKVAPTNAAGEDLAAVPWDQLLAMKQGGAGP